MTTPGEVLAPTVGRARMSPRKRARVSRSVQYVVLVAVVVAVAASTDWQHMREQVLNLDAAQAMASSLPRAALNTIRYTRETKTRN